MIIFPSDFHLGKTLNANTTFASRRLLKQKLYDLAYEVSTQECDFSVFCGDLFDSYSNNEMTIAQGYSICSNFDYVLAGNHDLKNQEGIKGSLQLIKEMLDEQDSCSEIVLNEIGKGGYSLELIDNVMVFMIPHHCDQELFESTIEEAMERADSMDDGTVKILCLHCNYNMPWDKNDTTLNLTDDDGDVLLDSFDYVLIGHEHNSNTYKKGRIIMLGNHHPTGFADIADKYIWSYDQENGMTKNLIWEEALHYLELDPFEELDEGFLSDNTQFVRIVGEIPSEEYPAFSKWMVGLWKKFPNAYAIKNAVETISVEKEKIINVDELESLPDTIRKELKGTNLEEIFEEILTEVE